MGLLRTKQYVTLKPIFIVVLPFSQAHQHCGWSC